MATGTGFTRLSGTNDDLSTLYELRTQGPTGETNLISNAYGKDLGSIFYLYANLGVLGLTGTAGANCGLKNSSGVDIGSLLCVKNSVSSYYSGFTYKTYANNYTSGYNAQAGNSQRYSYFDTATVLYTGTANIFVLGQIVNMNNALKMYGYFRPDISGSWTFSVLADDIATLWFGSSTSNPTSANYQSYTHFNSGTVNYVVSLTAGIYYPLLLLYGQSGGGQSFNFSFKDPLNVSRTNGTGYFFNLGV